MDSVRYTTMHHQWDNVTKSEDININICLNFYFFFSFSMFKFINLSAILQFVIHLSIRIPYFSFASPQYFVIRFRFHWTLTFSIFDIHDILFIRHSIYYLLNIRYLRSEIKSILNPKWRIIISILSHFRFQITNKEHYQEKKREKTNEFEFDQQVE